MVKIVSSDFVRNSLEAVRWAPKTRHECFVAIARRVVQERIEKDEHEDLNTHETYSDEYN